MFFLANLILWCAQQLGVTLGVGAETTMLAAYLISMQDGVVDEKETQYARAIKRVMSVALMLIVISGVGIAALGMLGESSIFTLAFFFKWLLIILALVCTGLRKKFPTASIVEGAIGGTWYALFLVHILNPATSLFNLIMLYAVWLVGFIICWEALVLLRRDKKTKPAAPKSPVSAPIVKKIEPSPKAASAPAIILGQDFPHPTPVPIPTPVSSAPKISLMPKVISTIPSSPASKVTDTPFLPAVPALQPIPVAPMTSQPVELAPLSNITTPPGGTSAGPVTNVPLSAFNVMPKKPADISVSK
jgi:hypothetical protein